MRFKKLARVVAMAVGPVLIVSGVALAASHNGHSSNDSGAPNGAQGQAGHRGGPPGPPPFLRGMTNAEVHSQQDGKSVVTRVDAGKVKSVGSDSVTLTENDGSDVTIQTDSDTKVCTGPGQTGDLSDLKQGQQVIADREEGQPAHVIAVAPKHEIGRAHV